MGRVVSRDELVQIVDGLKKQGKRIVTTNGTFDILHAGHVRALQEAKRLGDVLIVGVNSDSSVRKYKGDKRPIINENDRMEMLAALSCVDYVTLFSEPTPCELLEAVKPHLHAKSGDWDVEKMPETPIVRKHGGDVRTTRFVPGLSTTAIIQKIRDVYGTSSVAERRKPAIGDVGILGRFESRKILVLGDVMLDKYVWGDVTRISPEAPVQVVHVQRETFAPGGAANVACNIAALGGKAVIAGVVGNDAHKDVLLKELEIRGVQASLLCDDRPTVTKVRVMGRKQQLIRIDYEQTRHVSDAVERQLLQIVKSSGADAIVVSDYAKGCITQNLFDSVKAFARESGIPLLVDVKPKSRLNYYGASVVKTNHKEACELAGVEVQNGEGIDLVGRQLVQKFDSNVVITRGELGVSVFTKDGRSNHIPTRERQVFDVTGAGDTFLAAFALSFASHAGIDDSAIIANHAAGIKVGKVGTASVSVEELGRELL